MPDWEMGEADDQTWHMYERDLRAERKTAATISGYWYAVASLAQALPDGTDLLSATHGDIAGWLAGLASRADAGQLSSSTAATYARRLRTFYTHMIKADLHDGPHPMTAIARMKEDDVIMRCPDGADVEAVVRACDGKSWRDRRDMAMVRVLLEAGTPRASELAGIRLGDLDLRHDSLTLRGKGGTERVIPIGAKSCRALTVWLKARSGLRLAKKEFPETADLVFLTKYGPMTKDRVREIIGQRCTLAGVPPITPHDFRRFSYDKWDSQDGNAGAAMQLWGWRTPTMPILYGRQNAGRRAVTHARTMSLGDQIA